MTNLKKEWGDMSFEERRSNVDCYCVNHSLFIVNPCSKEFAELGLIMKGLENSYEVFKITRNESRDITFVHVKIAG